MAYNALNNLIDAYIYANGVQAITGQILNGVLKQMVSQLGSGYHLMGVAGPETVPASNDFAMAYFAATAGEYTDFGGITLTAGEVAVLLTSGNGSWEKQTIYNVPTGTADLENTADFITNAVTDLVNYYTKEETDTTLANYPTLEALATALADYYTKTEIDTTLADYATKDGVDETLADYYDKDEVDAEMGDRYTKSEVDTKLADYYRKAETYDKDEVDSIVAALSRQEYIVAWDGLAAPDVSAIPSGVTVTYSGTTYTGTLAASASTVNKIYMVWNGVAYDMYATSQDGGYSWVPMGTTTVDLSQYATKDEVSQLEHKVDEDFRLKAKFPNFTFLGNGTTAVSGSPQYGILYKGHTYRFEISNVIVSGLTLYANHGVIWLQGKNDNNESVVAFEVKRGNISSFVCPSVIYYTPTQNIYDLQLGGRNASGREARVTVYDITDEIALAKDSLLNTCNAENLATDLVDKYISSAGLYYKNGSSQGKWFDLTGVDYIYLKAKSTDLYFAITNSIPSANAYCEFNGFASPQSVTSGSDAIIKVPDNGGFLYVLVVTASDEQRYTTEEVFLVRKSSGFNSDANNRAKYLKGRMLSPFDLDSCKQVGYIQSDGTFLTNLDTRHCAIISLSGINSVYFEILGDKADYAFLTAVPVGWEPVSFANGYTASVPITGPFRGRINIPINASYLYVLIDNGAETFMNGNSIYLGGETIEHDIKGLLCGASVFNEKSAGTLLDGWWVGTDNLPSNWIEYSGRGAKMVDVPQGVTKLLVATRASVGCAMFLLKSSTVPESAGPADLATGITSRITVPADSVKEYELPNDCVAVAFNNKIGSTIVFPQYIGFGTQDAISARAQGAQIEEINTINTESLSYAKVTSGLEFIHAFSASNLVWGRGNVFVSYSASTKYVNEVGRTDDEWRQVVTKRNICNLDNEIGFATVAQHGELYNGEKVGVVYNMFIVPAADESVIYASLGVQLPNETVPTICTREINPGTMAVGEITPNTLSYEGHTGITFTGQSFLDMLFDLNIIDEQITYPDDADTIDNPKCAYYNGLYYKPMGVLASGKMVILTSPDMVNWTFFSLVGAYTSGEISLSIIDGIAYITYRNDTGGNVGYIVFDLANKTVVNDGLFPYALLSKPGSFIYRGKPCVAINEEPIYYGSGSNDLMDRQEVVIYAFINNEPTKIYRFCNHNGCQYMDIFVWSKGTATNNDSVIMSWTEDRRKLFWERQLSNVATMDIAGLLTKPLKQ